MQENPGQPSIEFQPLLEGENLLVRPLRADDFDALYAAASDPLIWEQHPSPLRYQRPVFEKEFFQGALVSGSAFVVIDKSTGKIIGSSRYYDWNSMQREIAIGFTFLARSHWGDGSNRELKCLMLEHAFRSADVVWFHIGRTNWRSRKAVEKIGAVFSHENTHEINGVVRDSAFYLIRPGMQRC
ncbi:MAG: GNAT family N-acetyltransferase [Pseudomonadota bacterium]